MPHCIVEHSATLAAGPLLARVFAGAMGSGLFEADGSDIKVRTILYDTYSTGTQVSDFVHVVLRILSGRTPEQR